MTHPWLRPVRSASLAAVALVALAGCPGGNTGHAWRAHAEPLFCESTIRAPLGDLVAAGMVQDLGTLQVGERAQFDVPAGTGSFLIVSQMVKETAPLGIVWQGFAIPNAVVPTNVRDPGGALVWDDMASMPADLTGLPAYFGGFEAISGTFGIPNTSAGLATGFVAPGTWSFTANDWAVECLSTAQCTGGSRGGQYRTYVVTRPGIDPAGSVTLDVEAYLATDPTNPVTALTSAANAASSGAVARWQRTLRTFLANAGIVLGEVRFHELSAADRARFAPGGSVDITDSGPCGNLQQLFTTATVQRRAVHLFLADELTYTGSTGSTTIVGVDGAIPGPSGFPGTINGGAIVSTFDDLGQEAAPGACAGAVNLDACGSDFVAYITAHEIGHWLGLFHTTESGGTDFDPLSDTLTCRCAACAPDALQSGCYDPATRTGGTTDVQNRDCVGTQHPGCGGGRNLMFWVVNPTYSTGELSPEQGQVARRSPAVR